MKRYYLCISVILLVILTGCVRILYRYNIAPPIFSREGGIYSQEFLLELTTLDSKTLIYYTLDGTDPTINSSLYTEPIRIYDNTEEENVWSKRKDIAFAEATNIVHVWIPSEKVRKAIVVKAVSYKDGAYSEVITRTYIVGDDYGDIPVLCLNASPDDLFGFEKGIYVKGITFSEWYNSALKEGSFPETSWGYPANFSLYGKSMERQATLEIEDRDAECYNVGIRIKGNATRFFEQKSFRIDATNDEERNPGILNLFDQDTDVRYDSFILRNWGNNYRLHFLVDPLVQHLVENRNIATQNSRTVVCFLNGEYWGLYDLKEDYGVGFFQRHYDITEDNLIAVKMGRGGLKIEFGQDTDLEDYNKLEQFVLNNDLNDENNYNILCDMMDMQSYIDIFAVRIYVEAPDYVMNNMMAWRSRSAVDETSQDGRWRWMLYDVDPDMRYPNRYNCIELFRESSPMFNKLLDCEYFRKQFIITMCDLMNDNFSYDNVYQTLTPMYQECLPYVEEYYRRFGPEEALECPQNYYTEKYKEMLSFFKNQPAYMEKLLIEENLVQGELYTISVHNNAENGWVHVNTISPEFVNGEWQGRYYKGCIITLSVENKENSTFEGWYTADNELLSDAKELCIDLEEDIEIYARYQTK